MPLWAEVCQTRTPDFRVDDPGHLFGGAPWQFGDTAARRERMRPVIFRGLVLMLGTRRGAVTFFGTALATFGLLGGLIQVYAALWPKVGFNQPATVAVIVCAMVAVATYRAWPRRSLRRDFDLPDIGVAVRVGDLFDEPGHLVVGFSDTFDTDMTDGRIISPRSVQGQFLRRVYAGDRARLDADLDRALASVVGGQETSDKPGKRCRFPMGTVATLGSPERHYFCVAYSYLRDNLIAKSTVDDLWTALDNLWDAVREFGQRKTLVIPVIGSDLARVGSLDRESLLKLVILSFVANSREQDVCKELVVVVHRDDYEKIDMLEVRAFLQTL